MTPTEIMARVALTFDVLYFSDPAKLEALMKDSMAAYQDRAGAVRSVEIPGPEELFVSRPGDLHTVVATSDANGRYIPWKLSQTEVLLTQTPVFPVKVYYLVDFRKLTMEDQLPDESLGLIRAHYEACLNVRNTRIERNVAQASGLQRELPTEDVLVGRVDAVEQSMEESQAIIPMVTVV